MVLSCLSVTDYSIKLSELDWIAASRGCWVRTKLMQRLNQARDQ